MHVYRHVWNGLRPVHKHRHVLLMSQPDYVSHRVDRPKSVGNVSHRDQACFGPEQPFKLAENKLARGSYGHHAQPGAFFLTQHLPWNYVGMVFHGGYQNLVSGANARPSIGL